MKTDYADYEALTVAELKDMADQMGVEIPHDARKADIIDALKAAEQKEDREEGKHSKAKEGKENTYEYQVSSTETALMSEDDFWRLKLVN